MIMDILTEGILDANVARKLLLSSGHEVGKSFGLQGIGYIEQKVRGFNSASKGTPILTLVDQMDTRIDCPVEIVNMYLSHRENTMFLRVVVREIESWILADAKNLSNFLKVPITKVPADPEGLRDPKESLINLARRSRSIQIKNDLVPKAGSTAVEGVLYTSSLSLFVNNIWDLSVARNISTSLDRCLSCLESANT